ncbi:MAG: RluA family pseudouridine synthase [Clostridia bacterium]|nr:RluA family pseudouridine synthase [Clostridia bacterium]
MRDRGKPTIKIIYEDNHLLVVEKPVNIPTQADESKDLDLLTLLKEDIKRRYDKPGNVYLGLVHRLDRPVGGVMVFAKTSKAASRLSDQMRTGDFKKVYFAVVHGHIKKTRGRLEHYLLKDHTSNMVSAVSGPEGGAKLAVLDYDVIHTCEHLSLVKVHLHTGRSHQIRVQFSTIGHPLYGDQRYGMHLNKPGQQIALWSTEIRFMHPTSKEEMKFPSLPPNVRPWDLFSISLADI